MTAYFTYDELEEENEEKFNMFRNLGITADDMYSMLQSRNIELEKRDLYPYTFPSQLDVKNSKIKPIYLGNYINWNYQSRLN